MGDGYNTTVIFDCGCKVRLNCDPDSRSSIFPAVGHWYACLNSHSAIVGYDPRTGEPDYDRDRQVVEVVYPDLGVAVGT